MVIIQSTFKKENFIQSFYLDLNNKDEKDGKGENNIESSKPKLATKQYLGIKPLQLLTEPKVNKKVMSSITGEIININMALSFKSVLYVILKILKKIIIDTNFFIFQESSPDPGLPGHLAANASLDLSKLILPGLGGSLDPAGVGAAGVGGVLDDPTTGSALQNLAKIASRYSKVCI